MAADGSSRLATALVYGFGRRLAQADPPSQFLHLDDLAAAGVDQFIHVRSDLHAVLGDLARSKGVAL